MKSVSVLAEAPFVEVIEQDKPKARPDGVVIKMLSAPVLSYMKGVLYREIPYMMPSGAFIPGSDVIGVVDHVGDEVFDLEVGQLVHGCAQIASRGHHGKVDDVLIGLTGMAPESVRVQEIWRDGAFAEYAHYPIDCVTPLDGLADVDPARLGALMFLCVPYGGFLALEFKASESVIIGGATGNFGAHAVLVALAMGASRVVPTGRNQEILNQLKAIAPDRIFPVVYSGESEVDQVALIEASRGGADCYYDITGGGGTGNVLTAIRALKPGGRTCLMGALGEAIQIPYVEIMVRGLKIVGNFMYPPNAPMEVAQMISSGLISLDEIETGTFSLDEITDALELASTQKGLNFTTLRP